MGQGSSHLTDDRKDSGIDSVANSLSTLSLNGHDSVKSYGCGGGSCSSSSIGAPPGGEEDYGTLMETNVMAMSTASAETDEGEKAMEWADRWEGGDCRGRAVGRRGL